MITVIKRVAYSRQIRILNLNWLYFYCRVPARKLPQLFSPHTLLCSIHDVKFCASSYKSCEGMEAYPHSFIISVLRRSEWPATRSGRFIPRKELRVPTGQKSVCAQNSQHRVHVCIHRPYLQTCACIYIKRDTPTTRICWSNFRMIITHTKPHGVTAGNTSNRSCAQLFVPIHFQPKLFLHMPRRRMGTVEV